MGFTLSPLDYTCCDCLYNDHTIIATIRKGKKIKIEKNICLSRNDVYEVRVTNWKPKYYDLQIQLEEREREKEREEREREKERESVGSWLA